MFNPKRPYFIRAMHEWIEDNGLTTYIMVDTSSKNLIAPIQYAQEGRLVLAISYQATKDLMIDNTAISFSGRFGGIAQDVWVPISAVLGIYAKEEPEHGLFFDPNEYEGVDEDAPPTNDDEPPKKPSHLRFV